MARPKVLSNNEVRYNIISTKVTNDLATKIKELASSRGLTVSTYMNELLETTLNKIEV
jgi:predicted DNA binding CopG/RHH family protein